MDTDNGSAAQADKEPVVQAAVAMDVDAEGKPNDAVSQCAGTDGKCTAQDASQEQGETVAAAVAATESVKVVVTGGEERGAPASSPAEVEQATMRICQALAAAAANGHLKAVLQEVVQPPTEAVTESGKAALVVPMEGIDDPAVAGDKDSTPTKADASVAESAAGAATESGKLALAVPAAAACNTAANGDKASKPANNGTPKDAKQLVAAGQAPVKEEFLVSKHERGERIRVEAVRSGAQQHGESSKEMVPKLSKRQQKKQRAQQKEAEREKRKLEGPVQRPKGLVDELNFPRGDLLIRLRHKDYHFPVSDVVLQDMGVKKSYKTREAAPKEEEVQEQPVENGAEAIADATVPDAAAPDIAAEEAPAEEAGEPPAKRSRRWANEIEVGAIVDRERKPLDFHGKTILAPLTTVGNLPFRRLCKKLGADVTVSEMAMATKLLQGHNAEWALVRRHKDEDIFGVQLAGGYSDALASCAELISKECEVDFIDINCGCPIDLVCNKGAGSALMRKPNRLETCARAIVRSVNVPVTLKLRMGFEDNNPVAHNIVPKLKDWGVTAVTIHGRSREQRYSKAANWEYIWDCARSSSVPLIGNGDVCDFEDQVRAFQGNPQGGGVAGIMIARGALYKPWVFTEIKEQRRWDITSNERFDLLKDYCNFGMEHWGADTRGVETTRRFLLEWLSYTCRYVPVGLLEINPQRLQWRTPSYRGRDDLETLMASESPLDWVKISEMLLGPTPEGFTFQPKHKSSAHAKEAEVEG